MLWTIKPGGLNLTWHGLDQESRSWLSRNSPQFEKWHLNKSWQSLCYKVSIFLNFYLCLDWDSWSWHFKKGHLHCRESLDTLKKDISTDQEILILIGLDQGWPDFFSHGPFSIICNVLGAASSFQEVEGLKFFWKFLSRFVKITSGSQNVLQKCHFLE